MSFSQTAKLLVAAAVTLCGAGCVFDGEVQVVLGGSGGQSPLTGGGGSGGSPAACAVAEECPEPGACETRSCVNDLCETSLLPAGTVIAEQTVGDCAQLVCDDQGEVASEVLVTDVPSDQACVSYGCSAAGEVAVAFEPIGTACGMDLTCDGAGVCIGCIDASQCPTPGACETVSCDAAGACAYTPATAGTVVPGDPANDCKRTQCDAFGNITTVSDDDDVPSTDSKPCTLEMCTNGVGSHAPKDAGDVVAAENGIPCPGVCQDGVWAGECGSSLHSRSFPTAGAWSRVALSTSWFGANAPPPDGIVAAELTTGGTRLLVFRSDGSYYERRNGVWQTPVAAATAFLNLNAATSISAVSKGRFLQDDSDDVIITTSQSPPQFFQYRLPESSASIFFVATGPVSDESGLPNAPPQHLVPIQWGFGDYRAPYPSTADSQVTFKGLQGNVYEQQAGPGIVYLSTVSESASSLGISGVGMAPAPGTVRAAFYDDNTSTVHIISN